VALTGDQRLDHCSAELAEQFGCDLVDLDATVSFSTLASRWPSLDRRSISFLAVAGAPPRRCHLRRRNEAGSQQPELVQLGDPLAVLQV
jgi:hypothetical protein